MKSTMDFKANRRNPAPVIIVISLCFIKFYVAIKKINCNENKRKTM